MAPAPSPNSTQVPRSFQSRMREKVSAPPVRHWSKSAAADRNRSPAPPNVLRSRDSLRRGRRRGRRAAVTVEHFIDLGEEIVADHLIANIDRIRKALGVGSAVALDHN